jgi:hypothetical protein
MGLIQRMPAGVGYLEIVFGQTESERVGPRKFFAPLAFQNN